jgi:hypothetical protein
MGSVGIRRAGTISPAQFVHMAGKSGTTGLAPGAICELRHNSSGMDLKEIFQTILVIDWPSKEVPETLARAGFRVVVRGGPGPEDLLGVRVW